MPQGGRRQTFLFAAVLVASVLASYPVGAANPKCGGRRATIVGTSGPERIVGTNRNDVIVALDGRDEIVGRAGHDRICGGPGRDSITGSIGDDRLFGGAGADEIRGGVDEDLVVGGGGADRLFGDDHPDTLVPGKGDDRVDGGRGRDRADFSSAPGIAASLANGRASGQGSDRLLSLETLIGSPESDALIGDDENNELVGHGGDDVLKGIGGFDRLVGGDGNDRIDGGDPNNMTSFESSDKRVVVDLREGTARGQGRDRLSGIDRLTGTRFPDVIRGSGKSEFLLGSRGGDRITAGGSGDVVAGGLGNDTLDGNGGEDTVHFGDVDRTVIVDLERGDARGQGKDELLRIESVVGSGGRDVIRGDAGDNSISGGSGDDDLFGRAGDDSMAGDRGNDLVDCGEGQDEHFYVVGDKERVRNCEGSAHADRGSSMVIVEPDAGDRIRASDFRVLRAREASGLGPNLDGRFALRRTDVHGCDWWSPRKARLVPGSCREPLWFKAEEIEDENGPSRWRYRFPHPLRPGRYRAQPTIGREVGFRLV